MADIIDYNPHTRKLDIVQNARELTSDDARYLKLDQTSRQTVSNGAPLFRGGITLKSGQRLTFDGN